MNWIVRDWKSNKIRFAVEILAWCISIGCSLTMAFTVPNPPLVKIYPFLSAGVQCMHGQHGLEEALECWVIIFY
jgi:hypothetical protein